jgi:hypothetical protein
MPFIVYTHFIVQKTWQYGQIPVLQLKSFLPYYRGHDFIVLKYVSTYNVIYLSLKTVQRFWFLQWLIGDLRLVGAFADVLRFPTNKTDHHDGSIKQL